ncbi:hypothetical protein [Actinophytocola sp.]|uniref:hypothetical protein n=1 Tax=Actinophytocola sp. TaxID=1872138 RepID=UPI003D6AAAD6
MTERGTDSTGRRSRWWVTPVVLAASLIVAAGLGVARPGGFVLLGRLDRPFLFGTMALGLLALASWLAVRHPVWRRVLAGLLVAFAVGWAALGALAASLRDDLREISRHRSPDAGRELLLYRGSNVIDPTWELRLRSGSGLTAREWDLGCVNSDQDSLTDVEWTGADGLRVHLSRRGPVEIVLDGSTGRPDGRISVGC